MHRYLSDHKDHVKQLLCIKELTNVLPNLFGKGRGARRGWVGAGGPSFGLLPVSQNLGPCEKLPFDPQSTVSAAYCLN